MIPTTFDNDLRSIQEARTLVAHAKTAANHMAAYTNAQVDAIIKRMVQVASEHAERLAKMAVEETGFGNVADKTFKNQLASHVLYSKIKDMQTVGVIADDVANQITTIAEPMGLLLGIIPSTNPTSTVIFKSIIALKARNGIVFSPHPSALKCTLEAATLMREAAVAAGAPQDIIGCVSLPSAKSTSEMMHHPDIAMIIATGGPGMVKSAYSSGTPALGVGAGNTPCYIDKSANLEQAVTNIIASKTFDYGTICASEQAIVVEACHKQAVMQAFEAQGGYFMSADETKRVCALLFKNGHTMNAQYVGRSAHLIATAAGISIPPNTRVLIGEQSAVDAHNPLSYEKLTTVLGFYTARSVEHAYELCNQLLKNGIGHTLSLHSGDKQIVQTFSALPASRILVNTGSSQGATGGSTELMPSFTLGCGTWGGSSISENVSPLHLINLKRVAYGTTPLSLPTTPTPSMATRSSDIDPDSLKELLHALKEMLQVS